MGQSLSNYFNFEEPSDYCIPLLFVVFVLIYRFKGNKKIPCLDFVKPIENIINGLYKSLSYPNVSELGNNQCKSLQILKDHEEKMRAEDCAFKLKLAKMDKDLEEHAQTCRKKTEETIVKIANEENITFPTNSYYDNYDRLEIRRTSPLKMYYETPNTMFSPVLNNLGGYRPSGNCNWEPLHPKRTKF